MEDLKSFKLMLNSAGIDGKWTTCEYTVKVNKPKMLKDISFQYGSYALTYSLSFSITIPDHIHAKLKGATVASALLDQGKFSSDKESRQYDKEFSKTLTRNSVEALTTDFLQIMYDYAWLINMESAKLIKVIFFGISTNTEDNSSTWNGIPLGKSNSMGFEYTIGYITKVGKSTIRYNKDKRPISSTYDKEFYDLKHVEWTPERQVFFDNIQSSFENIIEKLNKFEEGLSEKTINQIISNNVKLLS